MYIRTSSLGVFVSIPNILILWIGLRPSEVGSGFRLKVLDQNFGVAYQLGWNRPVFYLPWEREIEEKN